MYQYQQPQLSVNRCGGRAPALSDAATPDTTKQVLDLAQRLVKGENVTEALKQSAVEMCKDGVKQELYDRRYLIFGGVFVLVLGCMTAGYKAKEYDLLNRKKLAKS